MEEIQRIKSLFAKQYNGDTWLGVNFLGKLDKITPEQAAFKFSPEVNSIWEILNHVIGWRELVLQGIPQNGYKKPSHNYLQPIQHISDLEWEHTIVRLKDSQQDWLEFLENLDSSLIHKPIGDKTFNHYELIMGILHHDIYHLGQISLLVKLLKK